MSKTEEIGLETAAAVQRSFINESLRLKEPEKFKATKDRIAGQTERLLNLGFGEVIVITNTAPDKVPTEKYLGDFFNHPRVAIREMPVGYSWSNALNLAGTMIMIANREARQQGRPTFDYTVNISNEAIAERWHMEKMLAAMLDPKIAIVGTSFSGCMERLDGEKYDLSRSTSYSHPRNTLMWIKNAAIGNSPRIFDNRWDAPRGGMEDINLTLQVVALTDYTYQRLDLGVPLIIGGNYNLKEQTKKEVAERIAMDEIIAYWRSLFAPGMPERIRIDAAIAEMGIE